MIQSDVLLALPGIRHAFFTREGGVSTGFMPGSMAVSARRTTVPPCWRTGHAWLRPWALRRIS